MSEMTDLYPAHINPVRVGVYQVEPWENYLQYAHWNGNVWSFFDDTPARVLKRYIPRIKEGYFHEQLAWRGFTKPQEKT